MLILRFLCSDWKKGVEDNKSTSRNRNVRCLVRIRPFKWLHYRCEERLQLARLQQLPDARRVASRAVLRALTRWPERSTGPSDISRHAWA